LEQYIFPGLILLSLLWPSNLSSGTPEFRGQKSIPIVSYCDLVAEPEAYDGKEVTVRASYRYGFEWQELFCQKCRGTGKTWVEFDEGAAAEYKAALKKFPKHQGTVNAVFTGTFHSSKRRYGDGGYRFQFVVTGIRNPDVVSKTGAAPEYLSRDSQKRLCDD